MKTESIIENILSHIRRPIGIKKEAINLDMSKFPNGELLLGKILGYELAMREIENIIKKGAIN